MATEVVMPQMGESIAEGTITKWMKQVGDRVERDQPLLEVSTDKVDAEIPSPASGVLLEIRSAAGTTVPVNSVIGMIGDSDLNIEQEMYSAQMAPEVVQRVWGKAKELGYEKYFLPNMRSYPITDDHYPLLKAGLRVIDVIDYPWDWHHTMGDTADKVSAKSLKVVGDVAMALLR